MALLSTSNRIAGVRFPSNLLIERKYNKKKGKARLSINKDNMQIILDTAPKKARAIKLWKQGSSEIKIAQPGWKIQSIKQTQYSTHQQIKQFYNLTDSQYNLLWIEASRLHSSLLSVIESRLDVLLFRSQFASSIYQARELIMHGKVTVNNQICKLNSKIITVGSEISVKPGDALRQQLRFQARGYLLPNHLTRNLVNSVFLIKQPTVQSIFLPQNIEINKIPGAI